VKYLHVSPFENDLGELIGRDPREVDPEDLKALGHPVGVMQAIRANCIDCAGNTAEVRKCVFIECPMWPLRMGVNPLHAKSREAWKARQDK